MPKKNGKEVYEAIGKIRPGHAPRKDQGDTGQVG
jgi:hypothetical protein